MTRDYVERARGLGFSDEEIATAMDRHLPR